MKESTIDSQKFMPTDKILLYEVGKYLNFSSGKYIKIIPVDTSNKLILGKLIHLQEGVKIGINSNALNHCWERFVIVKELSHLIMSQDNEGLTEEVEILVDGLFQRSFGISEDIDHEHLALLMASEYLLPYHLSQKILKDKTISSFDIAKQFGVPEVVIQAYRAVDHLRNRDEAYEDMYIEHPSINLVK